MPASIATIVRLDQAEEKNLTREHQRRLLGAATPWKTFWELAHVWPSP